MNSFWNLPKPVAINRKRRYISNCCLVLSTNVQSFDTTSLKEAVSMLDRIQIKERMGFRKEQIEEVRALFKNAQKYPSAQLVGMQQKGGFLFIRIQFEDFNEYLSFDNSLKQEVHKVVRRLNVK